MTKLIELSAVLIFFLISSSAAFAASSQAQGPGSLFFILITLFLGYCALRVGRQILDQARRAACQKHPR
ncbi:hypothetical protein [Geoalkalibacter sp.]|uniref:hypothetical protein n=1 Tax=Geoalkalibacter sp. TaxID=3041440 RepID=UPI00272EC615|nr:hypothetical protein [Geoalkalibacter sp.]